jgi:hypothetical protein
VSCSHPGAEGQGVVLTRATEEAYGRIREAKIADRGTKNASRFALMASDLGTDSDPEMVRIEEEARGSPTRN